MSAAELVDHLDSLDSCPSIEERADKLASLLLGNTKDQQEFADELMVWHTQAQDVDFLLVYNPGGFGGSPMCEDPEWPSIMEGISSHLEDSLKASSAIVEHMRAEYDVLGFLRSVDDISHSYSSTAPLLAAKVAFLTKHNESLRVIITGRSNGAAFSNEVMALLEDDAQVYSLQAGRPAGYHPDFDSESRTLQLTDNGLQQDTLSKGDFWAIIKANAGHLPSTSPPTEGSLQILSWYLKTPGHTYTWAHEDVRNNITAFLDCSFGT